MCYAQKECIKGITEFKELIFFISYFSLMCWILPETIETLIYYSFSKSQDISGRIRSAAIVGLIMITIVYFTTISACTSWLYCWLDRKFKFTLENHIHTPLFFLKPDRATTCAERICAFLKNFK